jgi:hypothetical protein
MVLRVAPDMFIDKRFCCVTTNNVHKEVFRNPKFKDKYPWRADYKSKIRPLGNTITDSPEIKLVESVIKSIIETSTINENTGKVIDLSQTDMHLIACASTCGYAISSGDVNLVHVAEEEFDIKIITPLGLINSWLNSGLVSWNDQLQMVLEDWQKCCEAKQPRSEIKRFKKLTSYRYAGT